MGGGGFADQESDDPAEPEPKNHAVSSEPYELQKHVKPGPEQLYEHLLGPHTAKPPEPYVSEHLD